MGRKPGCEKVEEMVHMPESSNLSLEKEESQLKMQTISANLSSSKKKAENQTVVVRRSGRLQNSVLQQSRDIAPVIEEMDVSESEKEDEPQVQKKKILPVLALDGITFEEKIEHFQQLEPQQKTLEAPKSKATKRSFFSESPSETNVRYESLYRESQKKIETLTEENYQLGKKLENALGKLEVYEKGTLVFSEVLDKLKEVILISNVTKATETAFNLFSQAILGAASPNGVPGPRTSPAKRKKPAKGSRRN